MFACFHAPAVFADRNRGVFVQVTVQDDAEIFDKIDLVVDPDGDRTLFRMLPVDGIVTGESFSLYGVFLPPSALAGAEQLNYRFRRGAEESELFSVPLCDLPELPPLIITETLPWSGACACLELYNTTDKTLDLYDFEMIMDRPDLGVFRNPMADAPGKNLLPPHTPAVFRFLSAAVKNAAAYLPGADAFFAELARLYPATCTDIAERAPLYLECDVTEKSDKTGAYVLLSGCFDQFQRYHPNTLFLVPRGGEKEDAVFRLESNVKEAYHDVSCRKSGVWYPDARHPEQAVLYDSFCAPTPGFPDPAGGYPDAADLTPPAILPVSPVDRAALTGSEMRLVFAVLGERAFYPRVFFKTSTGGYREFRAACNNDGYYEVCIPYRLISRLHTLEYYIEVRGGLYAARYGSAEAPVTVPLDDRAGPGILSLYPADGQVLENETTPTVRVEYEDVSGVNLPISILCLDGRNITANAAWHADFVEYRPEKPLGYGAHMLELTLRDMLGNRTYRKVGFSVGHGRKLNCYVGQVHCHTGDSDGAATPEEAIRYARDVGGVDFFAVTDHSHHVSPDRYEAQTALADRYNRNGSFACIYGFEMTWNNKNGYWGHMNVLNTEWYERMIDNVDLQTFYGELKKHPEAVAMFNHPGDGWGNFHDYAYRDREIDRLVCLSEIRGAGYDREYALMLTKGWHAAPVYNEDNHKPNWTRATDACGVVLAPSLTRENILDAMRRRRTYTTLDRSTKVFYRVNGEWLGSTLNAPAKLSAEVEVHTGNELGIGLLQLVSEDNIVVAHIDVGVAKDFTWQVELDPDFDYYYVRITNGKLYTVTAPVFVGGRDLLNIKGFSVGRCEDEEECHVASLTLQNDAQKAMSDVRVDFYLSPMSGFELRSLVPYTSVHIGKLEPGARHAVSRRFPDVPGNHRLTAVVSGLSGKKRFADTAYVLLTPLLISKILPLTTSFETEARTVENPFAFVEIYNPTPNRIALKNYCLKLWDTLGVAPAPERIFKFGDEILPPDSTLTVWQRPEGSGLTAADFNARYGTSLVEGEDLIVTEMKILDPKPFGRRVDLCLGNELLARAPYGCFCSRENDIVPDEPLLFAYAPDCTATERRIGAVGDPLAPGKLLPEQKPTSMQGLCRREEVREERRARAKQKLLTRLTHAPLIPFEAAALVASAFSAVKDLFREK